MYKLVFFVPQDQKEFVKEALFAVGAGRYARYDYCSWEVEGDGQFRPLEGSNPFVGTLGEIERVREYRVEMICRDELVLKVIEQLIEVHPYEEPAYEVYRIDTLETL